MTRAALGFIGTGGIAEAMVTGLCRADTDGPRILVSRRTEARSTKLRELFPNAVEVVDDNQAIVDGCEIPIVAVMPDQAERVFGALRFREDQTVLSLVAGLRLERLQELAAPARQVCRAIPMPPVERGLGPIPLLPQDDTLAAWLGRIGTVVPVTDEHQFQALAAASAVMASYFELVAQTADWIQGQGVPTQPATDYATSVFFALSSLFDRAAPENLQAMSAECLTPGGLNEQVLRELRENGWFDAVRGRLDRIMSRLDGM